MLICNTSVVLMQGLPASGKSSLNKQYIDKGYQIISRDVLGGTMQTVLDHIKKEKLTKFIVDATLHAVESRAPFIEYAKQNGLTVGCHFMKTSKEDCLINAMIRMRKITGKLYYHQSEIPDQYKDNPQVYVIPVIFKQAKEMKIPKAAEGFDEIITTKFVRRWEENFTKRAVFVDLDGTVRETLDDSKWPIKLDNQRILPNSESKLREYKNKGYLIIAVSNQSDVNKGKFIDDVNDIIMETHRKLDNIFDDYMYCPHSMPAQICICRKPQSGMALYFRYKYELDFSSCIMVGDRTTDKTFAARLGMTYYDHADFFNR